MNKNRYKLIFSHSKQCLIPVSEYAKSAVDSGTSEKNTNKIVASSELPSLGNLSTLSQFIAKVYAKPLTILKWKHLYFVLASGLSITNAFAQTQIITAKEPEIISAGLKPLENNQNIEVDNHSKNKLSVYETIPNKVIIVDIAKPESNHDGISDNRFTKFSVDNGAVFNNHAKNGKIENIDGKSKLVGNLPSNRHFTDKNDEAKAILTQVTGSEMTRLEGGLEVYGKKADLIIVNQNGITLNGVRTYNSDRFSVAASSVITPNNGKLSFDVNSQSNAPKNKGKITVDVNGVATDGLSYLDLIGRSIEQKGVIANYDTNNPLEKNNVTTNAKTNITLVAGSSKVTLNVNDKNKDNPLTIESTKNIVKNNEIAITGTSAGAMHGNNIKLIVTDSGAGIKHDGIILSENDIELQLNQGELDLGSNATAKTDKNPLGSQLTAKKNLKITNAKHSKIGGDLKAENIQIKSKVTDISSNATINATNKTTIIKKEVDKTSNKEKAEIINGLSIEGERLTLQKKASIISSAIDLKSQENINIEDDAKIFSNDLNLKTSKLKNKGYIQSDKNASLNTDYLNNDKLIYAKDKLEITTKGARNLNITTQNNTANHNLNSTQVHDNGFINNGTIKADKEAKLTLKEQTSFVSSKHQALLAKDKLTINAENILIQQSNKQSTKNDLQVEGNLVLEAAKNVLNEGILTSAKKLNITAKDGNIINNPTGFIGGKEELILIAQGANTDLIQKGNIINKENAFLHTDGKAILNANQDIYNIGNIFVKKDLTVTTTNLFNDVIASGNVKHSGIQGQQHLHRSDIASHGWHNNFYNLYIGLDELQASDIDIQNKGRIHTEGNFTFQGKDEQHKASLYNNGLINVKGTFNAKQHIDKILNESKSIELDLYEDYFKKPANITFYFQPKARFLLTALSGKASRKFNSLADFLDELFVGNSILNSSNYYTNNAQASILLRDIKSNTFNKAMSLVFGTDWKTWDHQRLAKRWIEFKANHAEEYKTKHDKNFTYLPPEQDQAKFLAGKISGEIGTLKNGQYNEQEGKETIRIGKYTTQVQHITFKPEVNHVNDENTIDLSIILELLETPNLFIDANVQLDEFKEIELAQLDAKDKEILSKKTELDKEIERSQQALDEAHQLLEQAKQNVNKNKSEEEQLAEDLKSAEEFIIIEKEKKKNNSQTGGTLDPKDAEYLTKRSELFDRYKEQIHNGKENAGFIELLEKTKAIINAKIEQNKKNKQILAENFATAEKNKEELQKSNQLLQQKQKEVEKVEEKKKQIEHKKEDIKQKINQKNEQYKQAYEKNIDGIQKAKQQVENKEKILEEKSRIEEKRILRETTEKHLKLTKEEKIHNQEKLTEQERQSQLEKLETKEIKQREEKNQQIQKEIHKNTEEIQKEINANIEKVTEYNKKLQEIEQQQAELSKIRVLHEIDESRPKVDLDPLYRTRIKYINQKDYIGSHYFFNRIAPKEQLKTNQKLVSIGDNYFEHQLISRTIEKKADNHLELKYHSSGTELVKELMNNAYFEAKDLHLTLGTPLTKEQQAKLKQDIVWYVKSQINGKEVYLPQLYLAQDTIEMVSKYKGLGSAVIKAREIDLKSNDIKNSGTIAANNLSLNAKNKIKNRGSILATETERLIGQKGIESESITYVNGAGNTEIQKSEIKSQNGHLHIETNLDSNIDLTATDVQSKTAFIKTKDLNLGTNNTFERKAERGNILGKTGRKIGEYEKEQQKSKAVGSALAFNHLHVAVKNNLNQEGSSISTNKVTGIVQGNYNITAGKDFEHKSSHEHTAQGFTTGHASFGGKSASFKIDEKDGLTAQITDSDQTGLGINVGISITDKTRDEHQLTHKNSKINIKDGLLNIQGYADIGGADINAELPQEKNVQSGNKNTIPQEINSNKDNHLSSNENKKLPPQFQQLTEEEITDLMSEKSSDFYKKQAESKSDAKGFELSAKEIRSTKQQDEYDLKSKTSEFKLGVETEVHSSIADIVSHDVKQAEDAKKGIKQDDTVVLQQLSDSLNLATGDAAGSSSKFTFETIKEIKHTNRKSDVRNYLGGNLILSAREGSIDLNNIESQENANIKLRAKENINVNAGKSVEITTTDTSRVKISAGTTLNCGPMSGGCAIGVNAGIEGGNTTGKEKSKTYKNSVLKGGNISIESGRNLNLDGTNIDADNLDLNVQGNTQIVSKQDTYDKKVEGHDFTVTTGASIATDLSVKPNLNIGAGYTTETENSKQISQQAGITANKITGEINELNLTAGYLINKDKSSNFKVKGTTTAKNLEDSHHKDGGSAGGSLGLNESGTSAFNVRGGRADQKHYDATQQSTLTGVNTEGGISGTINDDITKSKVIKRNETIASSQFSFEIADLVELGQKTVNKVKSLQKTNTTETSQTVNSRRNPSDELPAIPADKVTKNNPIYESVESATSGASKRNSTDELPAIPTDKVTKNNPIYESVESVTSGAPRRNPSDELPAIPTDKVTKNNPIYESVESVTSGASKRNPSDELPAIPADKVTKNNPIYESVESVTSGASKRNPSDELPAIPTDKVTKNNPIYESVESVTSGIPRRNPSDELPAMPTDKVTKNNPIYESVESATSGNSKRNSTDEITSILENKGNNSNVSKNTDEPIYGIIDKSPEAIAKANARSEEAEAKLGRKKVVETEIEENVPSLPIRPNSNELKEIDTPTNNVITKSENEKNTNQQTASIEITKPVTERINQKELIEQSRSVLQKLNDQFQPLKVKNKIDAVRNSVDEFGGEISFKYAQSKGEVYKEIVKHVETQHGVCESTCAHWIAKKVNDESLWGDLYKDGQKGRNGGLNKETIESIKKLQTEFINSGPATQQFKLTNSWLEEQGVVPKEKKFGDLSRRDEVAGTVSKNDVNSLVNAILDTGTENSAVKKISINLEGGSHTVSASIDGQKVVFFDPNFGEISFNNKENFANWMKNAFWEKSGYAGKKEGKRFFNVVNYHKNKNENINQNAVNNVEIKSLQPIRPELQDTAGGKKTKQKELHQDNKVTKNDAENKSTFLGKIKSFFIKNNDTATKKGESSKSTNADKQKINYERLEDNINLKGLLKLEEQRSEAFNEKVLNNESFLNEAREIAKKQIPEATVKQLQGTPDFDEILTGGAKNVENRINNALTFKPSTEEFTQIQNIVKTLPKGKIIDDVNQKTTEITEALAATSKTIQGNPELKGQIKGTIETFLNESQGKSLTVEMIEKLNYGLRPDEGNDRLLYKKENLTKENAVFSSPEASKIQLKETVDFINNAKANNVEPSVLAGLVYQRLIAYHPFAEGNGRMARVVVNKLLLDAGYPAFTKFNTDFETKIIPQTKKTAESATSPEVVKEFLNELSKKTLPKSK